MIRKSLIIAMTAAALVLAGAGSTVLAANSYGTQPGYPVATGQTACAAAGAFGAFGPGNNWGNPSEPAGPNGHGADGPLTGSNNANLCGSPMGNP